MPTAAIYTRISIDPDGRSTATARQLEDCRRFAEARGWDVAGVYEDPDVSAYNRKLVRPAFERLKGDIAGGRVEIVMAWKLDRLFRRTRDFSDLDDICVDAGARIVTVVDGIDTGTSAGRMVATMLTGLARAESENISIRNRRKHEEIAQAGRHSGGGVRAYGYTAGRAAIVPGEARVIREATQRVIDGESLSGICADLNARGIGNSHGNQWTASSLRWVVLSYGNAGLRNYRGATYPAQWEAIVSPADHAAVRRIITDPARKSYVGTTARTHLLSGFAYCGLCGERLVAKATRQGYAGVRCMARPGFRNCGKVNRRADKIEEMVTSDLFAIVESDTLAELMARAGTPGADVAALAEAIRADERALEELTHDRYVTRRLGAAEFGSAHDALSARLAEARAELARLTVPGEGIDFAALRTTIRRDWPGYTLERRRRVLGALVERITVAPSPRGRLPFNPELITVHWRY